MASSLDEPAPNNFVLIEVRRLANGWWKATFPGIDSAEVAARSLAALRRRVRYTIRLFQPEYAHSTIVEDLQFRPDLKQMVANVIQERKELEAKRLAVHRQLRPTVRRLRANGLSVRDAAQVLGISTPYVQILGRVR